MSAVQSFATSALSSDVVLVSDGNALSRSLNELLAASFSVSPLELSQATDLTGLRAKAAVFCLTKISTKELAEISAVMAGLSGPPIFVFPTYNQENVDRVKRFGAEDHFIAPLDSTAIVSAVRHAINDGVEAAWRDLKPFEEKALRASKQSFESCFDAAARGERLPIDQVYAACENIQDCIEESNVDRWLGSLRQHHDCTYRHSMFVCGILAFFAHSLGLRGRELKQLTVGGFLHDAGKAHIPLAILDKPAKLDEDEWRVMRQHPEHSRDILLRESGLNDDIVAMAVHHHEKLDGTGYPDGLKGAQLNDYVRLTAISDVYSALVEERAYKPALPNEKALEIMSGFEGHLDPVLVKTFREFILDHVAAADAA